MSRLEGDVPIISGDASIVSSVVVIRQAVASIPIDVGSRLRGVAENRTRDALLRFADVSPS
jgi:hypothetical protein